MDEVLGVRTRFGRSRFARGGPVGVPTLILLVIWIGLWLLWPAQPPIEKVRRRQATRVTYLGNMDGADRTYIQPDLFGRSSRVGFRPDEETASLAEAAMIERPRIARLLEWQPVQWKEQSVAMADVPIGARLSSPGLAARPVFGVSGERHGVMVALSGRLKAAGFELREAAASAFPTNASWEVTARVEGGADGAVDRAFMLKGSGNAATDADVLREIQRGRATATNVPFRGDITLGWCSH